MTFRPSQAQQLCSYFGVAGIALKGQYTITLCKRSATWGC